MTDLWTVESNHAKTVYQGVKPLLDVGDIQIPSIYKMNARLGLLAGDLGLSRFEDELSQVCGTALSDRNLTRPFRILTAFWRMAQLVHMRMLRNWPIETSKRLHSPS